MKICVFSMAKNEEGFARRWAEHAAEADYMTVLDTGSEDGTADILRECGVLVGVRKFTPWSTLDEYRRLLAEGADPWRWDVARNASMALIPPDTDICVRVDMDEYFTPGWRKSLEEAWSAATSRARYWYAWSFNDDGSEGTVFYADHIFAYGKYKYVYANHEVPRFLGPGTEKIVTLQGCRLNHTPVWKASRSTNLPLLQLAVSEDETNARNVHYLGREYMYAGMYDQAIEMLKKHVNMPTSQWPAERAASMRYIARCCKSLGKLDEAELWYTRAAAEAPQFREAYVGLQRLTYEQHRWRECVYYGRMAVSLSDRDLSYISEAEAWGSLPWDLLSIAYWNLGQTAEALSCARIALSLEPSNERIANNVAFFESRLPA